VNVTTLRLSVEEVAYAMGLVGEPAAARGFLVSLLGDLEEPEMEGHLYAASHSLMARGLLHLNVAERTQRLDESLASMVDTVLHYDFSVQCSRSAGPAETTPPLVLFFAGRRIVGQTLDAGVISSLEEISDEAEAAARCGAFYGAPDLGNESPELLGAIPVAVLDRAAEIPAPQLEELHNWLIEAGLPGEIAAGLAEDLRAQEYRGSIIRIDRTDRTDRTDGIDGIDGIDGTDGREADAGGALSSAGLLLLRSARRLWVMELVSGDPLRLSVYRGGRGLLNASLLRLLADGRARRQASA
jgi:hypothetical protein